MHVCFGKSVFFFKLDVLTDATFNICRSLGAAGLCSSSSKCGAILVSGENVGPSVLLCSMTNMLCAQIYLQQIFWITVKRPANCNIVEYTLCSVYLSSCLTLTQVILTHFVVNLTLVNTLIKQTISSTVNSLKYHPQKQILIKIKNNIT